MPPGGDGDGLAAGYIARWWPSSVSPQAAAFARDVVAAVAPAGRERAKNLLWAAAKLADYAIGLGLDAAPEVLLHPSVIERFARCAPGLSGVARRTLHASPGTKSQTRHPKARQRSQRKHGAKPARHDQEHRQNVRPGCEDHPGPNYVNKVPTKREDLTSAPGRIRTRDPLLRRSFHAGGRPARAQVGRRLRCPWVTAGDLSFPLVLARMWHGYRHLWRISAHGSGWRYVECG